MSYQNCGDGFQSLSSLNGSFSNPDPNNPGSNNPGSVPTIDAFKGKFSPIFEFGKPTQKLVVSGKDIYFQADDGLTGKELWKYDTTTNTNKLVADLNPGPGGSDFSSVLPLNNGVGLSTQVGPVTIGNATYSELTDKIYFVANQSQTPVLTAEANFNAAGGPQWVHNFVVGNLYFYTKYSYSGSNTIAQTFRLENGVSTQISNKLISSGYLLGNKTLLISQENSGRAFYNYDGQNLNLIKDFPGGGPIRFSYVSNSEVYFFSVDAQICNLWRSDGTTVGTKVVYFSNTPNTCYVNDYPVVKIGTDIYFAYLNQLMKVNAAGTVTVLGKAAYVIAAVGNKVVFINENFEGGVTDGTVAGTKTIPNFRGASLESRLEAHPGWTVMNNKMYVVIERLVNNFYRSGLAVYDSTNDSLQILDDDVESQITAFNGRVFYFKQGSLSVAPKLKSTDGTGIGTISHQDLLGPGYDLVSNSTGVFFQSIAPSSARFSPWHFDGVKTLPLNTFAGPTDNLYYSAKSHYLGKAGNKRFFLISQSGPSNYSQLYSHDVQTGADVSLENSFFAGNANNFKFVGNNLFYIKNSKELWKTDGVTTGLVNLDFMNPINLTLTGVFGQKLILNGITSKDSYMTWAIDGNSREKISDSIDLISLVETNGFYFISTSPNSVIPSIGFSNGTASGTMKILDLSILNPGMTAYTSGVLHKIDNRLIFSVSLQTAYQLWSLDLTTLLPTKIKQVDTTQNMYMANYTYNYPDGLFETSAPNSAIFGNKVYFLITTGAPLTSQLWSTDGTVAGTTLIASQFGIISNLKATNKALFYYRRDSYSVSKYDLNAFNGAIITRLRDGIGLMSDKFLPYNGVIPNYMTYHNKAYFAYTDSSAGVEIWESDGTLANTKLAFDVEPGSASSNPGIWGVVNDELIFSATTKTFGRKTFSVQE